MSSWLMATTLVNELIGHGVTDVVLAPGSRSAALAIALARAEQAGRVRLHVRVDERGAGFLALGLAKASGRVVPVVCTSGTAVGNLLPAAMEARHAGVGWLALTCDRPAYRVGTGASQTTDQSCLFGTFAVANLRLSSLSGRPAYWAAGLRRALVAASGERTNTPGPAQVNVEFSAPMLGGEPFEIGSPRAVIERLDPAVTAHAVDTRLRTVVLVGDASVEVGAEARAFAEIANLPLLAEPTSDARMGEHAIGTYRVLLGSELRSQIEQVVTFGHPTLSRPVAALLSDQRVVHVVVADRADWFDVGATAAHVVGSVHCDAPAESGWLEEWRGADAAMRLRVDDLVGDGLSGYTLAWDIVASVGSGQNLVLGSSNPIRDADLAPISHAPATTWANRGLAGIDGTIATATGIALATSAPTTLLLGDLTIQHDIGSLAFGAAEPLPDLRIVVADDDGGSIFHTLEQGAPEWADCFERVFATPQGLDLAAITAGFGHRACRVTSRIDLAEALAHPVCGVEVIVASIPRQDRRAVESSLRAQASRY